MLRIEGEIEKTEVERNTGQVAIRISSAGSLEPIP
jgi:hypothetical protein